MNINSDVEEKKRNTAGKKTQEAAESECKNKSTPELRV